MSGTISRQAAIDAVRSVPPGTTCRGDAIIAAINAIPNPPTQDEATKKERDDLATALRLTAGACADHVNTIIQLRSEPADFRQEVSDALEIEIEIKEKSK